MFYAVEEVLLETEGNYIEKSMYTEDGKLRFCPRLKGTQVVSDSDVLLIDCMKITKVHFYALLSFILILFL